MKNGNDNIGDGTGMSGGCSSPVGTESGTVGTEVKKGGVGVKIGVVGGGNMGGALIGGLLSSGRRREDLAVAEVGESARLKLAERFGIAAVETAGAFPFSPDLLILAVKPNQLRECCEAVVSGQKTEGSGQSTDVDSKLSTVDCRLSSVVVSVAAGARWGALSRWLGGHARLVRAMPNTPALIGMGMTACFAPATLGRGDRELAEDALRAVGDVAWLECEGRMDAMTALSGCGPAYGYLLAEAMASAAEGMGLSRELSLHATARTLRGAAEMLLAEGGVGGEGSDPASLRRAVTSPGGATASALEVFAKRDFLETTSQAMRAAEKRAGEIGEELEGE